MGGGASVIEVPGQLASWCEVDVAALRHNTRQLAAILSPGTQLGVVVKSDAYGHGLVPCSRAFVEAGARWLIVNTVDEAARLRAARIDAQLLVCGPLRAAQAAEAVATGARVVVYDRDVVEALSTAAQATGRRVAVHLKVETGTHRQGVPGPQAGAFARWIGGQPGLRLEAVCTHFADVEDGEDHGFARQQLEILDAARSAAQEAGAAALSWHSASSAAALLLGESHGDLVRVGIAAYGLWPSPQTEKLARLRGSSVTLRPSLAWRTRIAQVKGVRPGGSVGYGRTYHVGGSGTARRIAVLPVGYYEGLDRSRCNRGYVLIRGQRAAVRGRICMNMTMVDVTDIDDVGVGDTATLIGADGPLRIDAAAAAQWAGTIHYETVARIHPSVPRLHGDGSDDEESTA